MQNLFHKIIKTCPGGLVSRVLSTRFEYFLPEDPIDLFLQNSPLLIAPYLSLMLLDYVNAGDGRQ